LQVQTYDQGDTMDQDVRAELNRLRQERLKQYKESGTVKYIQVLCAFTGCPNCQILARKKFTLEEALESPPLPNPDCTSVHGWCRCMYVPVT
jgi:hypothetical protein